MTIDAAGNFALVALQTREVTIGHRVIRYAIDGAGNRAANSDHVTDPAPPSASARNTRDATSIRALATHRRSPCPAS